MLRKYIYWLVIILVGWYLGRHFAELRHVVTVMSHGTWYWLLAAGALQVAHYGFHALNLQESFALFKIKGRYREYFGLALSSLAVNVVAPSLNISGVAYIVDEMRRRKHSGAAALVATMLTILIDGTVFVSFAVVAVLVLVLRQRASSGILLGVGALATVLLSVCLVLAYFWDRPHRVSAALQLFGKERAKRWGEEWHMLVSTPMDVRQLWRPFAAEYAAHTCNFATQLCVFLAFGVHLSGFTPIITYVVGVLFVVLSPTPMGIGFAEGGMVAVMIRQGVAHPTAIAIALSVRGLSFWVPFLIGTIFLYERKKDDLYASRSK